MEEQIKELLAQLATKEKEKNLDLKTQVTPQKLNVDSHNEDDELNFEEETDSPTILMIQLH